MSNPTPKKPIFGLSSPYGNLFEVTLNHLASKKQAPRLEVGAMPVPLLSQFTFMHDFSRHQTQMPFASPCRFMLERWVSAN